MEQTRVRERIGAGGPSGDANAHRLRELLARATNDVTRDGAAHIACVREAELPVSLDPQSSRLPHDELARTHLSQARIGRGGSGCLPRSAR